MSDEKTESTATVKDTTVDLCGFALHVIKNVLVAHGLFERTAGAANVKMGYTLRLGLGDLFFTKEHIHLVIYDYFFFDPPNASVATFDPTIPKPDKKIFTTFSFLLTEKPVDLRKRYYGLSLNELLDKTHEDFEKFKKLSFDKIYDQEFDDTRNQIILKINDEEEWRCYFEEASYGIAKEVSKDPNTLSTIDGDLSEYGFDIKALSPEKLVGKLLAPECTVDFSEINPMVTNEHYMESFFHGFYSKSVEDRSTIIKAINRNSFPFFEVVGKNCLQKSMTSKKQSKITMIILAITLFCFSFLGLLMFEIKWYWVAIVDFALVIGLFFTHKHIRKLNMLIETIDCLL